MKRLAVALLVSLALTILAAPLAAGAQQGVPLSPPPSTFSLLVESVQRMAWGLVPMALLGVFIVFTLLGVRRGWIRTARAAPIHRRQLSQEEAVKEFQRRRLRCFRFAVAPGVAAILIFALVVYFSGSGPWSAVKCVGVDGRRWAWLSFLLFGWAVVYAALTLRCPVCQQIPELGDEGIPLYANPESCARCGAQLR